MKFARLERDRSLQGETSTMPQVQSLLPRLSKARWAIVAALFTIATWAWGEGSLTGRVLVPDGTPTTDIKVTLIPETAKSSRRSVKLNKKGEFFFGLVPDGQYTLAVEGTTLVPRSIKLHVYDSEARKDVLTVDGPPPVAPQAFNVGGALKVTYDITLGPPQAGSSAGTSPPAGSGAAVQEVPGLLQSGDFQGALTRLDEALKSAPDDPSLHYYRGFALFKTKDYDKAKIEIQRTLELKPSQVGAHWVNGAVLASQGKKDDAIAEFQKELENPETDAATRINSYVNIGLMNRDLKKNEPAIAAFEKVLELDPKQSEAYSYLADLYLAQGKPDKAAEVQARSKSAGLEDAKDLFNIGADYWNKKDFVKAEEYFRRAVDLDPKFSQAWKDLGYTLINLGKTTDGAQALRKYLELTPRADDAKEVQQLLQEIGKQ